MIYNCHTHTLRSHDSNTPAIAHCETALAQGLRGLAYTDHCDCEFADTLDIPLQFRNAREDFLAAKNTYGNRLELQFGIELGDPLFNPAFADSILRSEPFDVVLLSVHAVRYPGMDVPFSRIDFTNVTKTEAECYLRQYFDDVLLSVKQFDSDILAHLTVPLRYINIKYKKQIEINLYDEQICEILKELIRKDKTLEVNTSSLHETNGFLMPDERIIQTYLSLGGKRLALGSDAHEPANLTVGFPAAVELLRRNGVKNLCYYKQRQIEFYNI